MHILPVNASVSRFNNQQKNTKQYSSESTGSVAKMPGLSYRNFYNINFCGKEELLTAAKFGNYDDLKRELENGTYVNTTGGSYDRTLLHWLVGNECHEREEQYKCLGELLSRKDLDINKVDSDNETALMRACRFNDEKIVELLLSHPDIDVNKVDRAGRTALIFACGEIGSKNTKIVELLLSHPDINVNVQSSGKMSALYLACKNNFADAVKLLVSHPGIDINARNTQVYISALNIASYRGYSDCVKELLKHPYVDVSIKWGGKTASEDAKEQRRPDIAEMIENYERGIDRRELLNINVKKSSVDITKLSPEENIWEKEEISTEFLRLVGAKKYDDAVGMLNVTPLINLDGDENEILTKVCGTSNPKFVKDVFDYLFHKQAKMQADYDVKRKEFLENTIKTLRYDELKNNNVALNTIDGFKMLIENPEFNPNDTVENSSLFERACILDPEGSLAKEILSKHGNVNTANAAKTRNQVIKDLIEDYEKVGKYRTVLNKIEDNAFYDDERRSIAADQLKTLLESSEFTPELADEVGNSVLHIAAALPDDMGRTLIQMALNKGVDINAVNCTGQRPLMAAIKKLVTTEDNAGKMNLMSNIKFLLDKGADVNAQDNNGQTAFHFACMSTVAALLTLLLSHEPNVFLKDKMGKRACVYLKTDEMKEIYEKYLRG